MSHGAEGERAPVPKAALALAELERRRDAALRPRGRAVVATPKDAERFLERVVLALRYGPGKGLPLASMFEATTGGAATGPFVEAAALTNHLLAAATAIEVYVIADRLTLVHRSVVPAVFALVRRGRAIDDLTGVSLNGRRAFALIVKKREVTVGDVRAALGVAFDARHDAGYEALADLARLMLVDRGPYEINTKGIHYLSKDGYPHHLFHEAHADLAREAAKLRIPDAADTLLRRYLTGAVFCSVRRLKTMFRFLMVPEEIDDALERLAAVKAVTVQKVDRQTIVLATPGAGR